MGVGTTLSGVKRYRQSEVDPSPVLMLVTIAVLTYVFAGFGVYWSITGSGTIGVGGRMSNVGELVWIGPIMVWFVIMLIGRRGSFTRLWRQPATLTVDAESLAWNVGGRPGSTTWDAISAIRPRLWDPARSSTHASIETTGGDVVAVLPLRLTEIDGPRWRRRRTTLVDLAVAQRPDRFVITGRALKKRALARSMPPPNG